MADKTSTAVAYRGTGKRKNSVARVILVPGAGTVTINGRTLDDYFPRKTLQSIATAPLVVTGTEGSFDVRARISGGGVSGQAGALRHGISRALLEADSELRVDLKKQGFLTRDDREVERKKAGLKKARSSESASEAPAICRGEAPRPDRKPHRRRSERARRSCPRYRSRPAGRLRSTAASCAGNSRPGCVR